MVTKPACRQAGRVPVLHNHMRAIEWSVCDEPLDRTFLAYTPFRTTSFLKAKTLLFVEDLHEM